MKQMVSMNPTTEERIPTQPTETILTAAVAISFSSSRYATEVIKRVPGLTQVTSLQEINAAAADTLSEDAAVFASLLAGIFQLPQVVQILEAAGGKIDAVVMAPLTGITEEAYEASLDSIYGPRV